MRPNNLEQPELGEPLAELERQLISAYVAGAGETVHDLAQRDDDAARRLLADASLYASERMSEIEARSHLLKKLHGLE